MLEFVKKIYNDEVGNTHESALMAVWDAAVKHTKTALAAVGHVAEEVVDKVESVFEPEAPVAEAPVAEAPSPEQPASPV